MSRCALFASDSDDDNTGVFSLKAVNAGDRAVSGASGSRRAEDPLSAGVASQLYPSSVKNDRSSTTEVQLPESSIVTATRRKLSQLFGAAPVPLRRPATSSPQLPPSATQASAAGNAANGAAAEAGSSATEAATFFAPRFDYDRSGVTGIASGAAAAVTAARGEAAAGLITAEHAVVQAYRDSLCSGTCMLALCVPPAAASETGSPAAPPLSAAVRRHLHERQEAAAASNAAAGGPTLMLISINRQVLCRVALDATTAVLANESLQLRQDAAQPQYLTFFDNGRTGSHGSNSARSGGSSVSSGCWWTCMFPDRDKASRFLVSAYTIAQYAAALARHVDTTSVSVPSVRTLPAPPPSNAEKAAAGPADGVPRVVRPDVPATMCWQTWELRRVSRRTLYCVPGRCIEVVPPSAPQTVAATDGTLWDAAAAALVGMREGESRLVFSTPEETHMRQLKSRADPRRSDRSGSNALPRALDTPVVIYMTCLQVASSPIGSPAPSTPAAAGDVGPPPLLPSSPTPAASATAPPPPPAAAPLQAPHTVDAPSTNALLQQLLLHLLTPPPLQQPSASATHQGPSQQAWESVERTLVGVQVQLGSLYEKIDRLDIEAKLQRNNTELERVMRKVVGLAPQEAVAIEDSLKDREALLASIELYRNKLEEANASYQRALEAVSRSSDRAQALERDLHLQQDLWARQRKDEAEQMRLRLVERDARHRDELERVGEERYAEGKSDGHAAGYREGRQATLLEVEGSSTGSSRESVVAEWRAKLMAKEQEVTALQMALQDAKFRHERDRRQLLAEIEVLSELNEKLQHLQANADVRVPEETVQQQCKRVKRMLNAVYSQVEGKLLLLSSLQSHSRPKGSPSSPTGDKRGSVERACEALGADGNDITAAVAVDSVLAIITEAIRSEAQAAVVQIRCDEAQRTAKKATLRELKVARRGERRQTPASYYGHPPATSSAFPAGDAAQEEVRGPEAHHSSVAKRASATPPPPPPPLPPVHTAASQDELAAVVAALLPEVAQAVSVKASAPESAGGAPEEAFRGDRRACASSAATHVTALPVAAEDPLYSEVGAKGSGDQKGDAESGPCPPYMAPAHTGFDANATSTLLSSSARERGADFPELGTNSTRTASSRPTNAPIPEREVLAEASDSEIRCSNVGDSIGDASHATPPSVIATADAATERALAGRSSSPDVFEKAQPVPTPSAVVATTANSAGAPAWMGNDNQLMTHCTNAELDMVRAVDIAGARTSRRSTSSLSSSSSTPAKPSRTAIRLSADTSASPPTPAAIPNAASLVRAAAERAAPSSDAQSVSSPSAALRDWQGCRLFSPPSAGGE